MAKVIAYSVAIFGVLSGSWCAAQAPLPGELVHLQVLVENPRELVDAVRRFDLQQQKLLEWDGDLARKHAAAGQRDLASIQAEESSRRKALIERAWVFTLQYYPNNPRANNYYGEFLYDYRGRIAEALQKWLLATRMNEDFASPHNNLGIHYFHVGDYDNGLNHLGKALKLDPKNPDFLYNLSQMYVIHFPQIRQKYKMSEKELYREAMRLSKKAAKYAPDDYEIVKDYAMNFFAGANFGIEVDWGQGAEAWVQARALSRNAQDRFYCHLQEGRAWIRADESARALASLNEARAFEPDSVVVQNLIHETEAKLWQ